MSCRLKLSVHRRTDHRYVYGGRIIERVYMPVLGYGVGHRKVGGLPTTRCLKSSECTYLSKGIASVAGLVLLDLSMVFGRVAVASTGDIL